MGKLTHLDERGSAIMVDVSDKSKTVREAVARGTIKMNKDTLSTILKEGVKKGDVFGVARVAGIMAAKKTPELIPLCHPIFLNSVKIDFEVKERLGQIDIICTTKAVDVTGVEMEAMTGVSVAALAIYDMCKALDKGITIGEIKLMKKSGGKSGTFIREE
ncbi:MAG: cyclic pyranopterin monophosphate synthase MoaC [bacterium]